MNYFLTDKNPTSFPTMTKFVELDNVGRLISVSDKDFIKDGDEIYFSRSENNSETLFPCQKQEFVRCSINNRVYSCCLTPTKNGNCIAEIWHDSCIMAMLKNPMISEYFHYFLANVRSSASNIFIQTESLYHTLEQLDLYDEIKCLDNQAKGCISVLSASCDLDELVHYSSGEYLISEVSLSEQLVLLCNKLKNDLKLINCSVQTDIDNKITASISISRFIAVFMILISKAVKMLPSNPDKRKINCSLKRSSDYCTLKISVLFPCCANEFILTEEGEITDYVISNFCSAHNASPLQTCTSDEFSLTLRIPVCKMADNMPLQSSTHNYIDSKFSTYNAYLHRIIK